MITELKHALHQIIEKNGRLSSITINISQQLDKLIVEEQKKMIDRKQQKM